MTVAIVGRIKSFIGLSSDTKPTDAPAGSIFAETDTGAIYVYTGSAWVYQDPTRELHARKTVAFDGSAGNGAVGTFTVFTLTGRVMIRGFTIFCSETLAGATATLQVGAGANINGLAAAVTATDIVADDWYAGTVSAPASVNYGTASASGQSSGVPVLKAISSDIIGTVGTAAITDGTLIIDAWYVPVTDDGKLAA
jgi:hypothetical protein